MPNLSTQISMSLELPNIRVVCMAYTIGCDACLTFQNLSQFTFGTLKNYSCARYPSNSSNNYYPSNIRDDKSINNRYEEKNKTLSYFMYCTLLFIA